MELSTTSSQNQTFTLLWISHPLNPNLVSRHWPAEYVRLMSSYAACQVICIYSGGCKNVYLVIWHLFNTSLPNVGYCNILVRNNLFLSHSTDADWFQICISSPDISSYFRPVYPAAYGTLVYWPDIWESS